VLSLVTLVAHAGGGDEFLLLTAAAALYMATRGLMTEIRERGKQSRSGKRRLGTL
jgi:hypothetical protein